VTTTLRGNRVEAPVMPSGQIVLQPPPELQQHEGASGALLNTIPMLGSVGSIVLLSTMMGSGSTGRGYIVGGMFLFATLGFVVVQIDRQRKQRSQQVSGSRTEYLRYLSTVRQSAREVADQQRKALSWQHPAPSSLPAIATESSRLWELTSADPRFLQVRYGLSSQPLAVELVPPESAPIDAVDPVAASALHRLLVVHRVQPDLPASIDLTAFGRVELSASEAIARSMARALICSAAVFHSPQQLLVAVLTSEETLPQWDWVKWLPHALSSRALDAVGPARMVSSAPGDLAELLPEELKDRPQFGAEGEQLTPHILLITDGTHLPPGNELIPADGRHGVTVIDLTQQREPVAEPSWLRLEAADTPPADGRQSVGAIRLRQEPVSALADLCDLPTAEAFARRLAHLRPVNTETEVAPGALRGPSDFMELLGLGDVRTLDPQLAWRPRPVRDQLRVLIGLGEDGNVVHLDLKESALQGMGPHGMVIGATGSGKSEFLRTLVLGLALTHSPERLNFVLADFKGGATFAGMAELPHVSALITNLEQELILVDRMQDALTGELVRRQELLREAGNFASIREYEKARLANPGLPAMPSLLIIVDEFSEMLAEKPEFIDLFVAIGRLGRSLGLHLLLASQRLEEGRLRGLESHLSYRVGLRTFSAAESRSVLGVPDASELPSVPGLGFLKPDQSTLTRFKAAYVSGPAMTRRQTGRGRDDTKAILPYTLAEVLRLEPSTAEAGSDVIDPAPQETLLELAVNRLAEGEPAARQIWLPPLDHPDPLGSLMPDLATDPKLGLVSMLWRNQGGLAIPLGTVDRPREQVREVLRVELSGAEGHLGVVGGPRSGKSTLLRTVVASLALTTTPAETQFFILDFGGGAFAPFARLPHVAGVATRSEPDVVRRVIAEVRGLVDRRERYFRSEGIDTIETYRQRLASGSADDGYGDVFLVVDGWATLRAEFEEVELQLQTLAARALSFGLHFLVSANRWLDIRAATRDTFGTRLELRLGDPTDSEIDRKVAALVPRGQPGRGLVGSKHHFLAALPQLNSNPVLASLGDAVEHLISAVATAWPGPPGPKLRLLPELIPLEEIRDRAAAPQSEEQTSAKRELLLGIAESDLAPVGLNLESDPHLLIFGDSKSGKSTVLRGYLKEVMRSFTPKEAQIYLVDYRRSLLGEVPEEYLVRYLTSAASAQPELSELAGYLGTRLPGPDITPEQLRTRSWWSGAEVFVVIDDYDLVATQQGSPVMPLQPLLAQARDIGLHVLLARRSGGASRALYEPVIQSLRDLAMPGLLLSGSPEEGPLLGTVRPARLPPGRGRIVTREHGVQVIQTAWTEPTT
jgi:DNA segregation ATPase FtsK/SpoIIIE, S-DNA-T family